MAEAMVQQPRVISSYGPESAVCEVTTVTKVTP